MHLMWKPKIARNHGSVYSALVGAMSQDIAAGRLQPGDQLPTHRELAGELGIAVTTVSRAYAEAQRRGLVTGEVGRGTFVQQPAFAPQLGRDDGSSAVNLAVNTMLPHVHARQLLQDIAEVSANGDPERLLNYQPPAGHPDDRRAGADWLRDAGVPCEPDEVVVTAGAQNGLAAAMSALARPGETVLVESVTYAGMRSLAAHLHLTLHGLDVDRDGLVPESVEAAVRQTGAQVLYCMPSLQNPTGTNMPDARREELAELARRLDLLIVEDDTYGFLVPRGPRVAVLAPERTCYVASLSKSVVPGLRVGFVRAPRAWIEPISAGIFATSLMATPLLAATATSWIRSGRAHEAMAWKLEEVRGRGRLARQVLDAVDIPSHPMSPHVWFQPPAPWSAPEFARAVHARGVVLSPGSDFAVDRRAVPSGVRVCLGPPRDRVALESALRTVAGTLHDPPASISGVV